MDSFMTFAVEFFVWAFVALLGVWFIGFLLQPLGFLLELVGQPAKPKLVLECHGHVHHSQQALDSCPTLAAWIADYRAGKVDLDGNPIPQDGELRACKNCGRNHFAGECPSEPAEVQSMADGDRHVVKTPGHRATDARTGEVVGYWVPKDA
jgi:hypothetical protein